MLRECTASVLVSADTMLNPLTLMKTILKTANSYIVFLPNLAVFAPIEHQASVQAANPVLPMSVSKADTTLAAVLMDFLKLYISGQITPPGPAPPLPKPVTTESSGQPAVVFQSDSTTAPAVCRADILSVYRMSSTPRGLAVIISNERFTGTLRNRLGGDIDVKNLHRLFSWLGYKMMLFVDLTAKEMMSTIQQLARLDHTNVDNVVLCILTHGVSGRLYGTDEELIPIEKVFELFNGANSPTLAGKPKIFLMQFDRGPMFDDGVDVISSHPCYEGDGEPGEEERRRTFQTLKAATEALSQKDDLKREELSQEGSTQVLPVEADFGIVYATPLGYVSWRNTGYGSWFIKAFVDVMFEHAAKCHFLEILTLLNNRLGRKFQSRDGSKQIAETTFRLMKLLYFNPPSPQPPVAEPGTDESKDCEAVSDPADPQWALPLMDKPV